MLKVVQFLNKKNLIFCLRSRRQTVGKSVVLQKQSQIAIFLRLQVCACVCFAHVATATDCAFVECWEGEHFVGQ